jgi:hypothetical protein
MSDSSAGKKVNSDTPLKVGDKLFAEDMGTWWPAEVLGLEADGRVKIHYTGFGESWDTALPRSALRLEGPNQWVGVSPSGGVCEFGPPPVSTDNWEGLLAGEPVTAETPLRAGDKVLVEYGSLWWHAEVVEVKGDGSVKIHYAGWESHWDEVVPRTWLQLPAGGPRIVTVYLGKNWSITGRVAGNTREFLVLLRKGDNRKVIVNKQSIACCEVATSGDDQASGTGPRRDESQRREEA